MNTNLQAVFDLILNTAIKTRTPKEDMPTKLYIVSDMQFDVATGTNRGNYWNHARATKVTNYDEIKRKFEAAGYEKPTLVYWNVNATGEQSPVAFDENGTMMVSGCSPTIFKNVMSSKVTNPFDLMLEVINAPRYERVKI